GMIINSYFLYHDHDPNGNFEIGPFKIRQAKGVSEYGVLLGYQWMEENLGYNIRFSVGVKHINKEFILIDNKKSKYLPNAQLTVGYAF
ncbi:MAG: hypothetical protein HRT87_07995, partial [Legionellales bacterium]|nr:hypothetical protein [Legionellales bacterium]